MKSRISLLILLALAFTLPAAILIIAKQVRAQLNVSLARPEGTCDIYAAGGVPCVAAHSSTRALYAAYNGPLYQVMRQSDGKTLDIGVVPAVPVQHFSIIHLVNMVAGENQHMFWLFRTDGVNVLVNRVRRAHVPVGAYPLHGGQNFNKLPQLLGHNARPSFADVPVERQRLVLRKNVDTA